MSYDKRISAFAQVLDMNFTSRKNNCMSIGSDFVTIFIVQTHANLLIKFKEKYIFITIVEDVMCLINQDQEIPLQCDF